MNRSTPAPEGGFQKAAGLDGIGVIIAERISDRVRHDDLRGEMRDLVDTRSVQWSVLREPASATSPRISSHMRR